MDDKTEQPKKEDEKIEINWKEKYQKIKKFTIKYSIILVLLLVIILQFIPNSQGKYPWGGMDTRMIVKDMPSVEKWAKNNVHQFYKDKLKEAIDKEYPNLPETNKKEVLDDKWAEFKEKNSKDIETQIEITRKQIMEHFQYEFEGEKYLYLPDIDPYHYLRKARNILKTGSPCDEIKNGKPWDNHMIAPLGTPCGGNTHAYLLAWIYKINKIFDKKIDLMQAAAKFSLIFIFLSIILAYFIGLKLAGKTGGFFAALMVGILPSILSRTPWGHADTDAYNIFFPLLAMFVLFIALDAKKLKNKIIFSILTGLVFVFYSYAWSGWWFVFDVIIAGLGIWVLVEIVKAYKKKNYKPLKNIIIPVATFFLTTGIILTILKGFSYFLIFLTAPISRSAIKIASHKTLWPNVFTTVAELNKGSMSQIIASIGGSLLFIIAVIGIVLALTLKDEKGKRNLKLAAILTMWFIASIYASLKGLRFMLLLGPAFSIAFGIGAGLITKSLSDFGKKNLGISKKISSIVLIFLFLVIIATSGISKDSYKRAYSDSPIVNDAWYNSLKYIRENSQKDAIINSWWDYGHHFKYFADRAVTFDGASQNSPMAHWIGRVLVTKDEKEAVGILRMLDCGSNTAFKKINEKNQDPVKSVDLIYEIIKLDKEKAKEVLEKQGFDNTEEILKYTHCNPPENFFITSGDMLGKAGVWAHFGLWNFKKADMWVNMRNLDKIDFVKKLTEKYDFTEKTAENYYDKIQSFTSASDPEKEANKWISPWPGYPSQWKNCRIEKEILKCSDGLEIDIAKKQAYIQTAQGKGIPYSLVYFDKDRNLIEEKLKGSNMDISVILAPTANLGYKSLMLSKELSTSIFTRLYFLDGHGLKYFERVYKDRELTQGELYVWKIDWNGKQNNLLKSVVPKEAISKGDRISINYIGWTDEEIFDSSIVDWKENDITKDSDFESQETKLLTFVAGTGQVIPGFDEAIIGMKIDEIKIIEIPPEKAYGTDPEAHTLGNKTLNFKIKVEKIL